MMSRRLQIFLVKENGVKIWNTLLVLFAVAMSLSGCTSSGGGGSPSIQGELDIKNRYSEYDGVSTDATKFTIKYMGINAGDSIKVFWRPKGSQGNYQEIQIGRSSTIMPWAALSTNGAVEIYNMPVGDSYKFAVSKPAAAAEYSFRIGERILG